MTSTIKRLHRLLNSGTEYISQLSEIEMSRKPSEDKWSKKEILGHLVDSGINNLQRFTEIQFENKPYKIRKYNQDKLVQMNNYQRAETKEISDFWFSINNRIINVLQQLPDSSLKFEIEIDSDTISDLKFLITDYVNHLEYHLNQIME